MNLFYENLCIQYMYFFVCKKRETSLEKNPYLPPCASLHQKEKIDYKNT